MHGHRKTVCTESCLWEEFKSLAAPGNRTCVSGVTIRCSNQLSHIPVNMVQPDQRRIRSGHLNWIRSGLPEAKRNHLAHGKYTGPEAVCRDLIRFSTQQERKRIGSDKTDNNNNNNKNTHRTGPLPVNVMWPSSRKFKLDHFRKNGRGPVVVEQNRACHGKAKLGQVCKCRGGTVQTGYPIF